jgi:UDP-N-acetylmuramate dehydrogenase
LPSGDPSLAIQAGVPLAPLTTLGIGGSAEWFIRATTIEEVVAAHEWCRRRAVPFSVMGGGSNLVIADGGVRGLVLQIAIGGIDVSSRGDAALLRVGAGEAWDTAVADVVSRGLQGLECLSGIPGSTGGTPVQNVGAYGQEVADTIATVTVLDRQSGEVGTLRGTECRFGYRTSRFKFDDVGRFVVCEVTYELTDEPPIVRYPDLMHFIERRGIRSPSVADVRDAVLLIRRTKGMVLDPADSDTRSAGSFFMNPIVETSHHGRLMSAAGPAPGFSLPTGQVKVPAAWLIEQAGFAKGYRSGEVGLSSKHPLAIINRGGATARDVVALARQIKQRVADRFEIRLQPEPTFVGFGDDADVAYLLDNTAAEAGVPRNRL